MLTWTWTWLVNAIKIALANKGINLGDPNPRGGADQNTVWILGADHTVHEFSKRSHGLGSTRGKLIKRMLLNDSEMLFVTELPV